MNLHMAELKDNMENKPNIKINKSIEKSNKRNNVHDSYNANNIIMDEIDGKKNDNKIKFQFLKKVIENEELNTKCKYIIIDDIKIKNIGNETPNFLYLIRDEKESSNDFVISQSTKINTHKLTPMEEPFTPGKIESHSLSLTINNPKVNQIYNMYLYVRENENGENISEPLKIVYKIKEDEEAAIRKKEEEER